MSAFLLPGTEESLQALSAQAAERSVVTSCDEADIPSAVRKNKY